MQGIIYLITNKITGKQYVGQTIIKLKRRWQKHCYNNGCSALYSAIKKYGENNFYIDQIDSAKNLNELNCKEIYWIKKLNTLSPNGYNLRTGGLNGSHSDETKRKLSMNAIGNKYNLGRYKSKEEREKISLTLMGSIKSEIAKQKLSLSLKGRTHSKELDKKGWETRRSNVYKYRGVGRVKGKSRYSAQIFMNGKRLILGYFLTEIEAAICRDNYVIQNLPKGSYLNFPDRITNKDFTQMEIKFNI